VLLCSSGDCSKIVDQGAVEEATDDAAAAEALVDKVTRMWHSDLDTTIYLV
jgi:hypothetical protein